MAKLIAEARPAQSMPLNAGSYATPLANVRTDGHVSSPEQEAAQRVFEFDAELEALRR